PDDALAAVSAGADAIGLNFHSTSPRFLEPGAARVIAAVIPPGIDIVGVFVDRPAAFIRETAASVGLTAVQLHGAEPPELLAEDLGAPRIIKAFRWKSPATCDDVQAWWNAAPESRKPSAFLLDAPSVTLPGGAGVSWSWNWTADGTLVYPAPIYLAGGLTPSNVAAAIGARPPFAVDVASGVESSPGRKSPELIADFIAAVRAAERRLTGR
ncbi:MAG TPA: phosphoribosylanthranilate isomerase, partial [Planctomycetia bacterium]|nr:phosphoribosylanthranilate isomerase [Planctomycetia bacterium]